MSAFIFRPLSPGYIRILEILPGSETEAVKCHLIYVRLAEKPSYEALSYCWGDPTNPKPITVDNAQLLVTANLHAALYHLRKRTESRHIWIDAVCINQTHDEEKGQQVQMMRQIYCGACRTVVWLGVGTEATSQGFKLIPRLANVLKLKEEMGDSTFLQRTSSRDLSFFNLPPRYHYNWRNFLAGFDLPYFTRIWIIQEVVVSSEIEVICGSASVTWDTFIDAIIACDRLNIRTMNDDGNWRKPWKIELARQSLKEGIYENLLGILVRYRPCHATDPRDKIFALLGLVDPNEERENIIVPEYRKDFTVEDAYISLACSILGTSGNLDLLSVPGAPTTLQSILPSWVPDWSAPSHVVPFISFSTPEKFYSSLGTISHPILRQKRRSVGIQGHIVDSVDVVGMVSSEYIQDSEQILTLIQLLRLMMRTIYENCKDAWAWMNWETITEARSNRKYITGEDMLEAYWMTFMGGLMPDDVNTWKEYRALLEQMVWEQRLPTYLHLHHSSYTYAPAMAFLNFAIAFLYALGIYGSRMYSPNIRSPSLDLSQNRRMFTTRGRYIGLGPKAMKFGDKIALCKGARVPLIIRRDALEYRLIGDCYIHGMMYGVCFNEEMCGEIWLL
jgi:hypothetical protein